MRFKLVVALLSLAVLAGCDDADYLVTTPSDPSTVEEPANLRESATCATPATSTTARLRARP